MTRLYLKIQNNIKDITTNKLLREIKRQESLKEFDLEFNPQITLRSTPVEDLVCFDKVFCEESGWEIESLSKLMLNYCQSALS